ncbi:ROK family transcriptional regulator [Blautia glucerasea]|uniref:ROK family transcriptional regulator n=1 Tax=Blautia glucerasea TaxID=536633 RepID=UPI001D013C14|nr:ROK family transcriptional regulator [Blautia glucerasea]MCB5381248.1 ROK family transcriptional regulator [Blautia glucerasea]
MSEKGLTTIALKKINRSKIYQYIYRSKLTSKLQIVQDLQMGLSTVSQNLNLLENEGLIEKNGYFDSTGGRKANAIQIVSDFRISIGVGILKNIFHITAIDLYGNTVYTDTIPLTYSNTAAYYQQITDKVKDFIDKNQYPENKILGVSIATQGITSPDNTTVIYGNIMNNTGMRLKDFSRHLPYPCHLEHDSKSAAFLELWNHPELDSAVVLLLNRNLGGAIITNHQIHQGRSMHSGTIEHICVNPDGPLCYCGNRGCLETYCSANSLEQASGMAIKEFFPLLREKKSPQLIQIWEDYLKHLAFAMKNLNLVIDAPIIISGYLAPYFTEDDTDYLLRQINSMTPFELKEEQILVGTHGQYTPAIGAALFYVKEFIQSV